MIVVDTSVWIEHLHRPVAELEQLLRDGRISQHPMVTGEIALGSLRERERVVSLLQHLPQCSQVADEPLLEFIEGHQLGGAGIGFVDANLLATSAAEKFRLWTSDKRLSAQAQRLSLSYQPS